jgi:hypothetical protein
LKPIQFRVRTSVAQEHDATDHHVSSRLCLEFADLLGNDLSGHGGVPRDGSRDISQISARMLQTLPRVRLHL